eukprot:4578986-Prymnesium_polylepis.2
MADVPPKWALPITSLNENKLLKYLGTTDVDRHLIEGLQVRRSSVTSSGEPIRLNDERHSTNAVVRLAANPPLEVGILQRRTATWLLRPFPLGLRLSGRNSMQPGPRTEAVEFNESPRLVFGSLCGSEPAAGMVDWLTERCGKSYRSI